jgi:hypothetical protein
MRIHHTARRYAARALAVGCLATAALSGGAAYAADHPRPVPRDANGNLTNTVTSTSVGANCVTGAEPGCATVVDVVPMADPAVGAAAVMPVALGAIVLYRRRMAAR